MAVQALLHADDAALKEEWLPLIASGEKTLGVAVSDHCGRRDSEGVTVVNNRANGQTMFALDVEGAEAVVIADKQKHLHLVNTSDIETIVLKSIDKTRSIAELKFHDAPTLLVSADPDQVDGLLAIGRAMIAADTLGAAQCMLRKAVDYAGERKQFNRVIGSFQAVKHLCAEMAADLEPCRSMVWYAAHSLSALPDEARLMTDHAKAHLAEVGRTVARKATEVHGGMGFTDLLGLHYWFKRIELNRQILGTPSYIRNEIAVLQGWT